MKKGITLLSLAVVIVLMTIITGAVVYTGSDTFKVTNKVKFAMEILDIQTKVDNYYLSNGGYPLGEDIDFDVSKLTDDEKKQITGETVTDNKIKLAKLDLEDIGIKDTIYGNNKTSRDVYAVSQTTGRVYYLKGFKYNGTKYYILTDELYEGVQTNLSGNYKVIQKDEVTFKISNLENSNEAVKMYVLLPNDATQIRVTATNSVVVGEETIENGYKKFEVNTGDLATNYDVEVKYWYGGMEYTVNHSVTNSDSTGPIITVTTTKETDHVVINVTAYDEQSGVKKIKCDKGNLTKEYFEKYGKVLTNNSINCYESGMYTIYAVDGLGNVTLLTQEITVE